ncbi:hypothetical protein CERZMDRAFT_101046 [Cercospora zeae-maydis SCOH1-5]|uniref:Uncharacterized protein n=1 Tax=Cercospora zeae-maydis SCOH1-5 TaxID=717836 RepID=A0A6A6F4Z1_9PEZI|nr:hypothetical protein CERZMDRAFT_101046 [Cercospora zeae-maydis SCOH1-5]
MSGNDFTDREKQIMSFAWQCFEGEPKLDYKKLAGLAGMSNPVSASNAWGRIKKKLAAQAGAVPADGEADSSSATKATPGKKRGRKALGEGEGGAETPSKACQKTKSKAGKGKKSGKGDTDEDNVEVAIDAIKTEKAEDDDSEDDRL